MEWFSGIIVLLVLILVVSWNIYQMQRLKTEERKDALALLQQQIDNLRGQLSENFNFFTQQLNERLKENMQILQTTNINISERLDRATQTFGDVQHRLGELAQVQSQVSEISKEITNLQDIFRAPRLRGSFFGELLLSEFLRQILPEEFYLLEYRFRSGEVVDAVIKLAGGLVPVDAKFPLENFRRLLEIKNPQEKEKGQKQFLTDLRTHIDEISTKYIVPEEGTFNFALFYIPAENLYYEIMLKDETAGEEKSVNEYALERKIIPVSPNSFYAYLQAIVLGLRGFQIEKNVRQIVDSIANLENDFRRFQEDFSLLGKHLFSAKSKFEDAEKKLTRFQDKLSTIEEAPSLPVKESNLL